MRDVRGFKRGLIGMSGLVKFLQEYKRRRSRGFERDVRDGRGFERDVRGFKRDVRGFGRGVGFVKFLKEYKRWRRRGFKRDVRGFGKDVGVCKVSQGV